ncbi:MAG: hypothetical protein HY331_13235 [Chloroflexi bacterium]|nr:hypothetical protein [Chloroflexota bacterium]
MHPPDERPAHPDRAAALTRGLLGRLGGAPLLAAAAVVLLLAVLLALVLRPTPAAPGGRAVWAYLTAAAFYLLATFQSAPILILATRYGKGNWAAPVRRAAALCAVPGVLNAAIFVALISRLPSFENRPSLWFGWPGAPRIYDTIAVVGLAVLGLLILYLDALPDLAAARDRALGATYRTLALGWRGTIAQWRTLERGLFLLSALYFLFYGYVVLLLTSDLGQSLVPGMKSAIFPPYHVVTGFQGALATMILLLAALRALGYRAYLELDQFSVLARMLLALSLLYFYFFWSGFIVQWYGRTPAEQRVLELTVWGPYLGATIAAFVGSFVLAVGLLIWRPIRHSVVRSPIPAAIVLVGLLFDRIRLYVAAWSIEQVERGPVGAEHGPASAVLTVPPTLWPDPVALVALVGLIGGAIVLYFLAIRFVPAVAIWEMQLQRYLRTRQEFLQGHVVVIGKPY